MGGAENLRFPLVQGDDNKGRVVFVRIVPILRQDSVDDRVGGEDIVFHGAAPLDDVILFRDEHTTPGLHGGAVEIAGGSFEADINPAAYITDAVKKFVAALALAKELGGGEDFHVLHGRGGVNGGGFLREAGAGEQEG